MDLSGKTICRLMREHRMPMRRIKARHGITLKRIREVRAAGVSGFMGDNWLYIITGLWPDETALLARRPSKRQPHSTRTTPQ